MVNKVKVIAGVSVLVFLLATTMTAYACSPGFNADGAYETESINRFMIEPVTTPDETVIENNVSGRPPIRSDTLVPLILTADINDDTSSRRHLMDYRETVARNVTLMSGEEDDAPLPEDIDFAEFTPVFARQMMDKFGFFLEELEGGGTGRTDLRTLTGREMA